MIGASGSADIAAPLVLERAHGAKSGAQGSKVMVQIPVPPKTGNKLIDDANKHDIVCLLAAFQDLIEHKSLRPRVFSFIHQEKQQLAKLSGISKAAITFQDANTISSIEDEFKIAFITGASDLSSQDIIQATREEPNALDLLCQVALQLPFRQALPAQLQVKDVTKRFWADRHLECGNRLAAFKQMGGLQGGRLSFAGCTGCYVLGFDAGGLLTEIKHCSGHLAKVEPKLGITRAYTLYDNHDDHAASLVQAPLPAIKLATFFPRRARQGPWAYTHYHGQPKEMARRAETYYVTWEADQATTSGAAEVNIKQAIVAHKSAKQRELMTKARAQAQAALQAKRLRRAVSAEGAVGKASAAPAPSKMSSD